MQRVARSVEGGTRGARRCGLACAVAIGALALACADSERPSDAPRTRPDVFIVVLDTTRADRLGAYGYARARTPQLDRFAQQAVLFERAWSVSSWTLPSHASLLTGRYPTEHGARMRPDAAADSDGANPARLDESATTLAELLAAVGYRTAAVAGAGWLSPEFGLLQGYELQDAENHRELAAEQVTDRALDWLDSLAAEEPAHLLVNYFDPHWPFDERPAFAEWAAEHAGVRVPTLGELVDGPPPSAAQYARMSALYDAEIAYMDGHVGRLFDGLRARGRFDDAMIVVIADHGELLGEHGELGHGAWLWEELLRIPLMVRWPGGNGAGQRDSSVVSTVDVPVWIAEATGIEWPDGVDGVARSERAFAFAEEWPSSILRERGYDRDLVAAIRWPLKWIASTRGDEAFFRLDRDPGEERPVEPERSERSLAGEARALRDEFIEFVPEERPISEEALERLRALGYVE